MLGDSTEIWKYRPAGWEQLELSREREVRDGLELEVRNVTFNLLGNICM
jgi:hypothetical protein